MAQQFSNPNIKIRTAILIFLKNLAAPLVLYFDSPLDIYNELKEAVSTPTSKIFELEPLGPIKKVCINANNIMGVALQEEQHIV